MNARQCEKRIADLLADKATEGLTPAEQAELERLRTRAAGPASESFELAAAAITLAATRVPHEPLPSLLLAKLLADARAFFGMREGPTH
jgi:hypothetical protein